MGFTFSTRSSRGMLVYIVAKSKERSSLVSPRLAQLPRKFEVSKESPTTKYRLIPVRAMFLSSFSRRVRKTFAKIFCKNWLPDFVEHFAEPAMNLQPVGFLWNLGSAKSLGTFSMHGSANFLEKPYVSRSHPLLSPSRQHMVHFLSSVPCA